MLYSRIDPLHLSGATPSAQALIVARYTQEIASQQKQKTTVVVLCPTQELAEEFALDLESLAQIVDSMPLQVLQFPTWEQSPYSTIALSIKTRLDRIAILSNLTLSTSPPDVIVTSIGALCQATLPKEVFQKLTLRAKLNQNIESREKWIQHLIGSGYLRVDPVEDPGTFAVRGDIIDIFPPHLPGPIRLEFFGDLLERIREFDPVTQRVLSTSQLNLSDVFIPPAREALIGAETTTLLKEKIKNRADDLGISRSYRDPLLAAIQMGNYPDSSDTWAPFAYARPATLLDYLPESSNFIWVDEFSCLQNWKAFLKEQEPLCQQASLHQRVVPAIPELYRWDPSLEAKIQKHSKLFLNRLEILNEVSNPETQKNRERVQIEDHRNLFSGTRHTLGELEPQLRKWIQQGCKVIGVASTLSQLERIRFLLESKSLGSQIQLTLGSISAGFFWPSEKLVVLTEGEILGSHRSASSAVASSNRSNKRKKSKAKEWSGLQQLSDLRVGDPVVHRDHGIGRYQGIVRLNLLGAMSDFLLLEYANKDKLYLPVYRLNSIQKYIGIGDSVHLDRLGNPQFSKTKEKVKEATKKLAVDLIQLYAERQVRPGIAFSPRDATFREFEAQFPFEETPDQLKAIDDVLQDMEQGRVMDRLVCGDVGYGKTEVAIRAAYRAVSDGKQVAVLVPTTVLAQQHEQSFKSRLNQYPLLIESLSRFKTPKEQKTILQAVAEGKIDIVIGTHRLLSKDIRFHDLGLIIVDEEHRFGVEHKERLKTLKTNTHVLTLTATPIPRTLHMALSGLRDISLINTPPVDRLPIRTYVSQYDEELVRKAIEFELSRGGQVFFLYNRVQSIFEKAKRLQELVPSAEVVVAHGQMPEQELEEAMMAFYKKRANVLVCTTIIESGIDLPSANTILIHRADTLGLAQLYQIRGRVGRGQQRAYAYLLIPEEPQITEEAKRRLEVIQRFVELGSGFSIASHDLEIRGGGDLLGPQQSGNIAAVGFDLYTELLEEAIREIQAKPSLSSSIEEARKEPEIKAPFPSFLSEDYVPDVHQRLSLYRRFSAAEQDTQVDQMEEELQDRFGSLPTEAQNLLWMIRIKILLKKMGIDGLTVGPEKISLIPGSMSQIDPVRIIALISAYPHQFQLMPDSKLVVKIPTGTLRDLYFSLEELFQKFRI